MSSTKQKLRLLGAFAALATLALAVSCHGFFQNPTWTTITIQPPNPTVAIGFNQTLQAWGTDTDGQRSQIKSNLVWSLADSSNGGTVATLDQGGILTGVAVGTVTVTASAEGISGTATATVAQEVATMTITPASTSVTDNGSNVAQFTITSGSTDLTSLVTLTAELNGTAVGSDLPCAFNSATGFQECTPQTGLLASGATQTYQIVVTYAGYTGTSQVAANLTVSAL